MVPEPHQTDFVEAKMVRRNALSIAMLYKIPMVPRNHPLDSRLWWLFLKPVDGDGWWAMATAMAMAMAGDQNYSLG